MGNVTFNEETIRYISFFQDFTRATVVDCLDTEDRLIFVVKNGEIGKVIGKKGENISKIKKVLGREVYVIEHSDDAEEFIRNIFRSYGVKKVEIEKRGEVTHATVTVDAAKKGKAIGRNGKNLKIAQHLISRHHPVQSVSVA